MRSRLYSVFMEAAQHLRDVSTLEGIIFADDMEVHLFEVILNNLIILVIKTNSL